jgi:hypothetical protein
MVRKTVLELEELQQELVMEMMMLPTFTSDQKKEHLNKLKNFLEKQKIFFFRISLSDDKDAIEIKNKVIEAAKMFGYNEVDGMDKFFERLDRTIKNLEQSLDR